MNDILTAFKAAEARAAPWYQFQEGNVLAKVKRALFLREKYLVLLLHRMGLKKHATARLFFGKRLWIPLAEANALKMYFLGTLGSSRERPLTAFLSSHLMAEDVFYDVGANFGFYSFLAEAILSKGEVHAFEPNPRIYHYLAHNAAHSHVVAQQLALSNMKGDVTFFDTVDDSSGGSLIRDTEKAETAYADTTVPATTLDAYVATHRPPSVIKIDVEGAEQLVLEGAVETLKKYRPVVILEVWGGERGETHHAAAIRFLLNVGYTPHRIDKQGDITPVSSIDISAIRRYENFVFLAK